MSDSQSKVLVYEVSGKRALQPLSFLFAMLAFMFLGLAAVMIYIFVLAHTTFSLRAYYKPLFFLVFGLIFIYRFIQIRIDLSRNKNISIEGRVANMRFGQIMRSNKMTIENMNGFMELGKLSTTLTIDFPSAVGAKVNEGDRVELTLTSGLKIMLKCYLLK